VNLDPETNARVSRSWGRHAGMAMIRDDSYEMNESNESCIANVSNDAVCGNDRSDFARIGVL
jgi:hypothetical protein